MEYDQESRDWIGTVTFEDKRLSNKKVSKNLLRVIAPKELYMFYQSK